MGDLSTTNDHPLITAAPFFAFSVTHEFSAPVDLRHDDDTKQDPDLRRMETAPTADLHDVIGGFVDRTTTARYGEMLLRSIRTAISDKCLRDRFDRLFRHQDAWLHDSIAWALSRDRTLRKAIAQEAPIPLRHPNHAAFAGASHPAGLSAPLKLGYLLYQERKCGGAPERYAAQAEAISPACSRSAERLSRLLEESERWYAEVLAFVVHEPWIAGDHGRGATLAEALSEVFPAAAEMPPFQLVVDACGAPDAYVAEGYAAVLIDAAMRGDNDAGRAWLGAASAVQKQQILTGLDLRLRGLTDRIEPGLRLQDWREMFRSGVVHASNSIRFDIGNSIASLPEIALHEMSHLAYAQMRPPVRTTVDDRGTPLLTRRIDRGLDEGLAELLSGAALRRLAGRYPLVTAYRRLRFALLRGRRNDPHIVGFAVLKRYCAGRRIPDARELLRRVNAADHDLIRLLDTPGEHPSPAGTIEGPIAAVPEVQIAIGAAPELTSLGFRRRWCTLAIRGNH